MSAALRISTGAAVAVLSRLTFGSVACLLLIMAAIRLIGRRKRIMLYLLILAIEWGFILCFHHRTQRYLLELLPGLVFLLATALCRVSVDKMDGPFWKGGMALLILISVLLTGASAVHTMVTDGQHVGEAFSAKVRTSLGLRLPSRAGAGARGPSPATFDASNQQGPRRSDAAPRTLPAPYR